MAKPKVKIIKASKKSGTAKLTGSNAKGKSAISGISGAKVTKTKASKGTPAMSSLVVNGIVDRLLNASQNRDKEEEEAGIAGLYPGVGTNGEDLLANVLSGLKVNNLDAYISDQLRNDFIRDENYIRGALNNATNASYDVQRAQALRDAANSENTNLANTRNAIAEMRRNLIGSASSGANVGAANATALQALLGLGQQNTQVTTEGLQNVNNVERERAATLAQNAVDAISQANDATNDMYGAATSAYGSDRSYAAQGAAQAVGEVKSTDITNQANERMNDATNAANEAAAKMAADAQKYAAKQSAKAERYAAKMNYKAAKLQSKKR